MDSDSPALTTVPATPVPSGAEGRHDGWSGEVMARFCEVLAETGVVSTACRAVGKSRDTAYANRRRNPLFEAAWQAALSLARNRLADALLARSIEGSVDYFYRDGELVGERRYVDNRLAYAMLRRLDRMSEAGLLGTLAAAQPPAHHPPPAPPIFDWDAALSALRTGTQEDLCTALAMVDRLDDDETDETDETDNLPDPDSVSLGDRVWEEEPDVWWTNFPPPPNFAGEERERWEHPDYRRECTPQENALLSTAREARLARYRAEEESERDSFFSGLATPSDLPLPAADRAG